MGYLIAGLLSFLGLMLLAQTLRDGDPHKIAQGVRWGGAAGLGIIALFLLVTGRVLYALPVGILAVSLLQQGFWQKLTGSRPQAGGTAPGGGQSGVETATLRMSLDHGTGSVDGLVLQGPFEGQKLSALDLSTVLELRDWVVTHDPASVGLVESFLDRTHNGWRGRTGGSASRDNGDFGMTRARALDILGLADGATVDEIKAAHRKLMHDAHPDHGGSPEWAAQLNAAKDYLLGR